MIHSVQIKGAFRVSKKIRLSLVEALALSSLLISSHAFASTGSSWSGGSNWGGESNSSVKSTKARSYISTTDVSPFSPGSHNLGLDLGQVFLMGGLTQFNDSLGMKLHYNYGVSDLFSFDSSLGYSTHSEGKYGMTSLLTGIRVNLSWYDKIIPYCSLGLGFYRPTFKDLTSATSSYFNSFILKPTRHLRCPLWDVLGPRCRSRSEQEHVFWSFAYVSQYVWNHKKLCQWHSCKSRWILYFILSQDRNHLLTPRGAGFISFTPLTSRDP